MAFHGDGAGQRSRGGQRLPDPAAPGVIVIAVGPDPIAEATIHATLADFQIAFKCSDETVTTATAASGSRFHDHSGRVSDKHPGWLLSRQRDASLIDRQRDLQSGGRHGDRHRGHPR